MKRGDVWWVDLDPAVGSEQDNIRPCVIIQNDLGNKHSPTTIIAAITDAENVIKPYPFHVFVSSGEGGLRKDSIIQLEQIRTVAKIRVIEHMGKLSNSTMAKVDNAIKQSLQL